MKNYCAKCKKCSINQECGYYVCADGYYNDYHEGWLPVIGDKAYDILEKWPPCDGREGTYIRWNESEEDTGETNPALYNCGNLKY